MEEQFGRKDSDTRPVYSVFSVDIEEQELRRDGTLVSIARKPFRLLELFVSHPGTLLTHDAILNALWPDTVVTPGLVKDYVATLRKSLGDDARSPRFIETMNRRGYRYIGDILVVGRDINPSRSSKRVAHDGSTNGNEVTHNNTHDRHTGNNHDERRLLRLRVDNTQRTNEAENTLCDELTEALSNFRGFNTIQARCVVEGARATSSEIAESPEITDEVPCDRVLRIRLHTAKSGDCVIAILTNNHTARVLWSRTDTSLDLEETEARRWLVRSIAATVATKMTTRYPKREARDQASEPTPDDFVLLAESLNSDTLTNHLNAQQALEAACELDPDSVPALSGLARRHQIAGVFQHSDSVQSSAEISFPYALRAYNLDRSNSDACQIFAQSLSLLGEYEDSHQYYKKSIELNPSNSQALAMYGTFLCQIDRPDEAVYYMRQAIALDSEHPDWFQWGIGMAYSQAGNQIDALRHHRLYSRLNPGFLRPKYNLAVAYARAEKLEQSEKVIADILADQPDANMGKEHALQLALCSNQQSVDLWLEPLRKAGLPD